jgi:predicted TIM-barrel fold metal-dependent hydrolase
VIIDVHTHIFPPEVRDKRAEYLSSDPTFAEMYADPAAKIATAEDLLASMNETGVDISVVLGFAWRDPEAIAPHNDYLLESAARSGGRIIAFTTVNMAADGAAAEIKRCAGAGARGIGELRPESQGWDLNGKAGELLAGLAAEHQIALLFHVTEPGGHEYPGKHGLSLGAFYRFQMSHAEVQIIAGHLGGGLPLSAPASQAAAVAAHVAFDTAAQPFLYPASVYSRLAGGPFRDNIVMGSDFPLISQRRQIDTIRQALAAAEAGRVLGGNAARLLGIEVGTAN